MNFFAVSPTSRSSPGFARMLMSAPCMAHCSQWLDEGPGKDIDLEECPRSRLEKERICYLNAEQRQNFLVVVDDDGLLRWKRSGKPLNTTKFHKNAGPDVGIVEISKEEVAEKEAQQKERRRRARAAGRDISSSSSSSSSSDQEADVVEGAQPYGDKVRAHHQALPPSRLTYLPIRRVERPGKEKGCISSKRESITTHLLAPSWIDCCALRFKRIRELIRLCPSCRHTDW